MSFAIHCEQLARLQPLKGLPEARLQELLGFCRCETFRLGSDPFALPPVRDELVYLLTGELRIGLPEGGVRLLVGGDDSASHALIGNGRRAMAGPSRAITDVVILYLDRQALDVAMTWEQLALAAHDPDAEGGVPAWSRLGGAFKVEYLARGCLSVLPAAHIHTLLQHFERFPANRGQQLIYEGDEGDYYYLIESGRCEVFRQLGGSEHHVAELRAGEGFGEEALVSESRRNASVRMITDGVLLRLPKAEFVRLMRAPLLHGIDFPDAVARIKTGEAKWLDVRYAADFATDALPGAVNIPLNEIRLAFPLLEKNCEYLVYCQSGRRSSAAAFLLAQAGFRASWLTGGLARWPQQWAEQLGQKEMF